MKIVRDIMVTDVMSLNETDNVHYARMLMKENHIRHLPVLSENSTKLKGVISQHSLLNNAFNVVEKFGLGRLEKKERQTDVGQIMQTDCDCISSNTGIEELCEKFLSKKYSALMVVDEDKLVGIVTSVDFVKLSLYLLKNKF